MLKLYSFYWDSRGGSVEGLFIEHEDIVERCMGCDVYFGEILGKHSEVMGTLDKEDLRVLSEDQELIQKLLDVFGSRTLSGYNPIDTIEEDEEELEEI